MKPLYALDFEKDDMREHHGDIQEDAKNLQAQVSSSLQLSRVLRAVLAIGSKSDCNADKHGDETEWNINGERVEQWYQVHVHQS